MTPDDFACQEETSRTGKGYDKEEFAILDEIFEKRIKKLCGHFIGLKSSIIDAQMAKVRVKCRESLLCLDFRNRLRGRIEYPW